MGRRLRKLLQLSLGWCLRKRRPSIRCVQCRGSLEGSVLSIQEAQAPDRERTPRLCWAMGRVGARGWLGTGSGLPPGPGLFLEHKPLLCAQCPAKDGGGSRWGGEGPLVSPRWVCVGKLQPRRRLWIRARRWPACLLQVRRDGKWSRPTCLETQHPSLLDPGWWHRLSSLSIPAVWGLSSRGVAQLPGRCLRIWASERVADCVRQSGQRPPELPAPPRPAARSAHVTPLALPSASSSVKWV